VRPDHWLFTIPLRLRSLLLAIRKNALLYHSLMAVGHKHEGDQYYLHGWACHEGNRGSRQVRLRAVPSARDRRLAGGLLRPFF